MKIFGLVIAFILGMTVVLPVAAQDQPKPQGYCIVYTDSGTLKQEPSQCTAGLWVEYNEVLFGDYRIVRYEIYENYDSDSPSGYAIQVYKDLVVTFSIVIRNNVGIANTSDQFIQPCLSNDQITELESSEFTTNVAQPGQVTLINLVYVWADQPPTNDFVHYIEKDGVFIYAISVVGEPGTSYRDFGMVAQAGTVSNSLWGARFQIQHYETVPYQSAKVCR